MKVSVLAAGMVALGLAAHGQASEFPSDTIEVVTHSGAGGGTDLTARAMMRSVEPLMDTDMVIVNKPGGAGDASLKYLGQRPADGYTVLTWTTGHAVRQAKNGETEATGLIPIARATNDPQVLMTKCGAYEDAESFIDAQKDKALRYGVTHVANIDDVSAFMFGRAADIAQPNIVSFKGGGELQTNLVGGNIDVAVMNYGEASSQIEAGTICPMVVMSDEPLAEAPDVATTEQLGIDANYSTVRGFAVREGTPDAVVDKLRAVMMEGMQGEAFGKFLTNTMGLDPKTSVAGADAWGEQMDSSVARMNQALIELGYIKP
ncbi:Bug family tripartite tricarboxylate transporter substrate binding protein [Kushneria indalinina]|uniref:Tripartite-type tricarboxylate transporter receptor subunit TctC n=1 Tax=Kushneria indalinina DSM 14324 TaxID=1122140 RepID=A0A3D9DSY7_9GAMM|nr:tripartite tricarboxylate transporter substrate binding protein [Kushneria indalinina]REC93836.1 tripartite-type tricarboxylate transporter receptor subunit TctC [Kushneria indalinina DSM 14324]